MYLFIFESLGTWELILIGIIALIVFGPRKLPELAKKAGKVMREVRSVSNEFRETWEKEVSGEIDDTKKTLEAFDFEQDVSDEIEATTEVDSFEKLEKSNENSILPEVREVTSEEFNKLVESKNRNIGTTESDKQNWL